MQADPPPTTESSPPLQDGGGGVDGGEGDAPLIPTFSSDFIIGEDEGIGGSSGDVDGLSPTSIGLGAKTSSKGNLSKGSGSGIFTPVSNTSRTTIVRIDDSEAKQQLAAAAVAVGDQRADDGDEVEVVVPPSSLAERGGANSFEESLENTEEMVSADGVPRKKKGRARAMTTKAEFNAAIAAAAFAAKNKDVSNSTLRAFGVAEQLVKAFQSDQDEGLLDSIAGSHLSRVADESMGEKSWSPYHKSEAREQALSKKLEDLLYSGHGLGARLAQKRQEEEGTIGGGGGEGGMYLTLPDHSDSLHSPASSRKNNKRANPHPLDTMFNSSSVAADSPLLPYSPSTGAYSPNNPPSSGHRSSRRRNSNLYQPGLDHFDHKKGANGMGQQQLLQVVAEAAGRIPKRVQRHSPPPNIQLSNEFEAFGAAMAESDDGGSSQYSDMDDGNSRASSRGAAAHRQSGSSPKRQLQLVSPKKRRFPMIEDCKNMIKVLIPNQQRGALDASTYSASSSSGPFQGRTHHPTYVMVSPAASRAHSAARTPRRGGGDASTYRQPAVVSEADAKLERNWNGKGVPQEVAYNYHTRRPYSAADVSITTPNGDVLMDGLDTGSPFSNTGLLNRHCCYGLKGGSGDHHGQNTQAAGDVSDGVYNLIPGADVDTTPRPCKPVTCRMKASLKIPALRSKIDYATFCGKPLPGNDDAYDRQARASTPPTNGGRRPTPQRASTPPIGSSRLTAPTSGFLVKDDFGGLRHGTPLGNRGHIQQGQLLRKLLPPEALEYMSYGVGGSSRSNSQGPSANRRREVLGIEASMTPTKANISTTEYFIASPTNIAASPHQQRAKPMIRRGGGGGGDHAASLPSNNNSPQAAVTISPAYSRLGGGGGGSMPREVGVDSKERDSRAIRAMLEADRRQRTTAYHHTGADMDDTASSCSSMGIIVRGGTTSHHHNNSSDRHGHNHHTYRMPVATTPTVSEYYSQQQGYSSPAPGRRGPSSGGGGSRSRSPAPASPHCARRVAGGYANDGSPLLLNNNDGNSLSLPDNTTPSSSLVAGVHPDSSTTPTSVADSIRMKYSRVLVSSRGV